MRLYLSGDADSKAKAKAGANKTLVAVVNEYEHSKTYRNSKIAHADLRSLVLWKLPSACAPGAPCAAMSDSGEQVHVPTFALFFENGELRSPTYTMPTPPQRDIETDSYDKLSPRERELLTYDVRLSYYARAGLTKPVDAARDQALRWPAERMGAQSQSTGAGHDEPMVSPNSGSGMTA